jgi:L-alanine-DL-glutamate epimerase-like enolase superfamily enzyme
MKIDSVDFFYLRMPEVLDIGDGSQDALLVRVRAGGRTGWGECEASPLVTIAALVAPMSHSACKPVRDSVLGQELEDPDDIRRINASVRANSADMLQADHALSGIDIALWDLLGRKLDEPVWRLLGYTKSYPKRPYASVLFGDSAEGTTEKARAIRKAGFRAAKFGWGPFGKGSVSADRNQILAARLGLEEDGVLLVDAGCAFGKNVEEARRRLNVLQQCRTVWLEEPFAAGDATAYRELAADSGTVKIAGGEGCHNLSMAKHMIDDAGLGYIQIDAGRIGGITTAKEVADHAREKHVTYVNHTFTSHLALSASLQPFAGIERDDLAEYPFEARALATELTKARILPDEEGLICAPEAPGLGIAPDPAALAKYLVNVDIRIDGKVIYRTPSL